MKRVLLVLAVLVLGCCLASCGRKASVGFINPDEVKRELPDEVQKIIKSGKYDADIVQILQSSASRELPESTYDKIHRAFLDGEIDREAEVLLTLQAAYSPEDLPKKYKGPKYIGGKVSLRSELQWLINHHRQLDPKTRAVVTPFVLSPEDPGSYFHPAFDNPSPLKGLTLAPPAHASETQWSKTSVPISGVTYDVILYYREQGLPAGKQAEIKAQVQDIQSALQKAWPMFVELLGVHLQRDVHVFLTDKLAIDTHGDAVGRTVNGTPRYEIRLNESRQDNGGSIVALKGDDLKSVVAHELFHCFQYEMGLTWYDLSIDLDWLTEATAVWAEHFVYPKTNREHEYLEEYFGCLYDDRLSTTSTQEYGSYMLFYFLTESLGKKNYVPDILWAAAGVKDTMDIRGMLMRVIDDIKEVYGKFALYNWNHTPVKFYTDKPSFPDPARAKAEECNPSGASITYSRVQTRERTRHEDFLNAGGMVYKIFHFDVPPEKIEKVRFDFREENADPKWVKRQALIRLGDSWLPPEDWTDLEYRDFCRKQPQENVVFVVLILSNAGLGTLDHTQYACVVDTEDKCADLKGFVTMKWEMPGLQSERMTINERAELHSEDELVYCSDCDRYVLRTRNVTYGAHRYVKNVYIAESGIIGGSEYTREDSGSLSEEYEPSKKFSRLFLHEDGKTVRLNGLPDIKADDWITIIEKTEDENFGVRSQTENKKTSTVLYSNFDDIWTGDFKVGSRSYTRRDGLLGVTTISDTCEITSEYIAGTRKVKTASGSVSTLEFKFRIITPLNK